MKLLVATGCPLGGWEMVLPVLDQMGFEQLAEDPVRWEEGSSTSDAVPGEWPIDETPQLPPAMIDRVTEFLHYPSSGTLLLADSRNLPLLDLWAEKFPHTGFLLFYTLAELPVTQAILKGHSLQHYLDIWQDANRQLLDFQRRHRAQTLLFDAETVLQQPQEMASVCNKFGLDIQNPKNKTGPSAKPQMERVFAAYWLSSQPAVLDLQAELEATAHPLGNPSSAVRVQPIELLNDFRQRQEKENTLQQKLSDTSKKLLFAEKALKLQTEKNDQLLKFLDKSDARIKKSTLEKSTQLLEIQNAHMKLKSDYEEAIKENEALVAQLHRTQEEIESIFLQKQHIEERAADKEKQLLAQVEQQKRFLAMIKSSASWKFTAPIRSVMDLFRRRNKTKIQSQIRLVRESGFFDEIWYLEQYPDVKTNGTDPVEHYIRFGAAEGRNPSPEFDSRYYLENNSDVSKSGMNPLVHFIHYGRAEGRFPGP